MRALPRGPIHRLANLSGSAAASAGVALNRGDWNCGRDIAVEEQRSGILLRLRQVSTPTSSIPPLEAIVKAQTSDFQVNELDASGAGAFLDKKPKGRWRKISRQKTIPVEDTPSTPFSDPAKTFTPRVQSYGEYVRLLGKLPEDRPVLRFVLYRDGYSTGSVLNRLHYEINVDGAAVHLHDPPGGHFGCVSQFGVCVGVTQEQLPHASRQYNLHPLIFDARQYSPLADFPSLTKHPKGYLYRVLLRCVGGTREEIVASLKAWSEGGFVNYFGVEKFGLSSNTHFDLAVFAQSRHDLIRAIGCYLQGLAESDPFHHDLYLAYVNADPSTVVGVTEAWLRQCQAARIPKSIIGVIRQLHQYHAQGEQPEDLRNVWLEAGVEQRCRRSAAEFVWNAMASQRLISHGDRVVKGDVVALEAKTSSATEYKLVTSDEEASRFTLADVVLPVPYEDCHSSTCVYPCLASVNQSFYSEFCKRHHLGFLMQSNANSVSEGRVSYRPLVSHPQHLQVSAIHDPSSLASLKNDLFLLQERKQVVSMELDFDTRVRTPCVYNVSERFAERMQVIRQQVRGEYSVVLSFALSDDISPLAALREVFQLKYANFHDLYQP